MAVRLRPMRDDEFDAYVASSKPRYARDLAQSLRLAEEEAHRKADDDFATLLPDRLATEGQFLFAIEDDASGEQLGSLWFGERERAGARLAFVWDLFVVEDARGRRIGRDVMLLLEERVRELGIARIELNVFPENLPARGLYRSLDYFEQGVWMGKKLDDE